MTDRLMTVILSVIATLALQPLLPALARRGEELEVDRLIVRRELIVSDTGKPW